MSNVVKWARRLRAKQKSLDLITGNLQGNRVCKMWLVEARGYLV